MRAATAVFGLLRETFAEWIEDRVPRLGAALAYYTVFALAPLIIIATLIAGVLWGGQEFAQQRLLSQISQYVGSDAARLVNEVVNASLLPRAASNVTITIGVISLVVGAFGIFGQLQDAFDTIWEVTPNPRAGILRLVANRLQAFAMLLVVGFLLLIAIIASTVLTAVGGYLETRMAYYALFAALVNGLLPLVLITVLIGIMFKVVPNVKLAWRDVVPGALLTAVLFGIAKYAIGFYLGSTRLGTAYGAAGSVIVILVWVYFSAQILFFGAEFTQVYVKHYGHQRPVPLPDALPVTETERVKQGMPRTADVEAAAKAVEVGTLARPKRRFRLPSLRRKPATGEPATGPGVAGIVVGFLAGVGTGALVAALTLRWRSQHVA